MNISNAPQRRSTFWSRLRENYPQTPVNTMGHRRKSRSPDGRVAGDELIVPPESSNSRKRKKQSSILTPSIPGGSQPTVVRPPRTSHDETASDRGRKPRRRPQSTVSEDVEMRVHQDAHQPPRRQGKNRKKGRSRSRDATSRLSQKAPTPEPQEESEQEQRRYTGPLAAADYNRMREELEKLKQHMEVTKKTIKQQSKVIDGLRRDLTTAEKSHGEKAKQVEKLRVQLSKSDEAMSSIEANLNCQICMEILLKPYGLSPCGHVLCLTCLQEWFRAAPPGEDEMYEDDTPDALIYRKKTCPVCRAIVLSRPIPLFLVKSMAHALEKSKQLPNAPPRVSPPPDPDADPWAGIFTTDDYMSEGGEDEREDEWSFDDDNGDDDEDDHGYGYGDEDEDQWGFDGYGTDDDDDGPYEGEYSPARWAPPTVYVSPDDYSFEDITEEQLSMLRRGATLQMVALFSMSYSHEEGLKAIVDGNELYLGWNIVLNGSDHTGEEFMDWAVADVYERPERWEREGTQEGFIAWRMVREEEEEEYETTDSEAWAADLAIDDDEF